MGFASRPVRGDRSRPLAGHLEDQRDNIEACIRCGLCLETCPTYRLGQLEEQGPRGRIAIAAGLLNGSLGITSDLIESQLACLLCDGCTAVCPAGVRMEPLGTAMRAELLAAEVVPRRSRWVMRALRILGRPRALERAMRILRRAHRLKLVNLAGRLGVLRHFGVRADSIPVPPQQFLPIDGSGWVPVGRVPRETVELFAGCIMSTMFADVDVMTAELLAAAGYGVVVTDGQGCCGALSAHAGDLAVAKEMAARNVAAFRSDRRIVSNSAGCGAFIKQYGEILGSDGESVARRVVDISELLAAEPPSFRAVELPGPVVYQDPCHARLAQGIIGEPRTLLRAVPGLVLVEAEDQDMCCGSAGVHNIVHPRTADELGRRKAHALVESGASMVVTSNPGCLMQVQAALRSIGSDLPVIYLVDLLRRALPDPIERTTAQRP